MLTNPQRTLLAEINERDQAIVRSYAPAKHLVKRGFAEWKDAMFCDVLCITDAGRDYLKDASK